MASSHERLLYAAKNDDVAILQELVKSPPAGFSVNYQDGLGNSALHYAASAPSPDFLDALLDVDGLDVDLQNRLDGDTPLHLAVKLSHEQARLGVANMLLDAGADPRIKNKRGALPIDLLTRSPVDEQIKRALRVREAELQIDLSTVARDDDDDDDDGPPSDDE